MQTNKAWVDALCASKSVSELHPAVIAAVAKINPLLFGSDRSTADIYEELASDVQPAPSTASFSCERFAAVFSDLLDVLAADLNGGLQRIELRRRALADEEEELRATITDRLSDFLAEVHAGSLSPTARAVLQQKYGLLRQLRIDVKELNRRAR